MVAKSNPNVVFCVTRAQLVHVALQDRSWVSGDSSDPQLTELGVIALRLAEHEAARA